ncbi:MAG: D-alanyl-D-alanine carboxypeptidase [Cyclobacteriaceae bacterium]
MPDHPSTVKLTILILISAFLGSCTTLKISPVGKNIDSEMKQIGVFDEHFTGVAIYDPQKQDWLYRKNSSRYFTPASNTKLLTYYASLVTLDDYLASLQYEIRNDTLYFTGMGDPTFLHRDFPEQRAFNFLQNQDSTITYVYVADDPRDKFGAGWAWDDYNYDFQPEMSGLPIYGNIVNIAQGDSTLSVTPSFFEDFVEITEDESIRRDRNYNHFIAGSQNDSEEVDRPFITSPALVTQLLGDTLDRKIYKTDSHLFENGQILSGTRSKWLYQIMMLRSDNFFAEQLLLMGSKKKSFGWETDKYRYHILSKYLNDLPQPIIWQDGSGLSRYNLVTPESMVSLLLKIEEEAGFETIKQTFPVGGVSGTIRKWYSADEPYIYAKTGTLSNNHNLSGFLITRSGKRLVFSLMNNNYIRTSAEIKEAMQQLLEFLRDNY